MARPARVDMRWRKPWFLARLRLFGWNVRFTKRPLWRYGGGGGAADRAPRAAPAARVEADRRGGQPAKSPLAFPPVAGGTVASPLRSRHRRGTERFSTDVDAPVVCRRLGGIGAGER